MYTQVAANQAGCVNSSQAQLRVQRNLYAPPLDRITDPGIPEHCISLHLGNPGNLERWLDRRLDSEKLLSRSTFPGTLTFVPALRSSEWLWGSEVEILDIYVPPAALQEVAIASNLSSQPIELLDRFAIIDPLLQQLILTLFTQVQQKNKHQQMYLESLQNLLAAHLLQFHCTVQICDVEISIGLSASKLKTVLDYIHDHLDSEIGLGELAAVVQLSSHHFGKLFKQSMSISPHQYVLRCRIARAKQLLASPQRSLVNIGQAIGFSDQSHFTNTFRRYTGLTPRQYRQQL